LGIIWGTPKFIKNPDWRPEETCCIKSGIGKWINMARAAGIDPQ